MIALAVMFGRGPVALRGAFVVLRRLAVSVLRHASPPLVATTVNAMNRFVVPIFAGSFPANLDARVDGRCAGT
jgi:hypothetical protein